MQSVHQLGIGIDSALLKWNTDSAEALNSNPDFINHVNLYTENAIKLAYKHVSSTDTDIDIDIDHYLRNELLINHPIQVVDEWIDFLKTIYKMI